MAQRLHLYLEPAEREKLARLPGAVEIDRLEEGDSYGTLTLRIAGRWKHQASGVAFGDPAAILARLASH